MRYQVATSRSVLLVVLIAAVASIALTSQTSVATEALPRGYVDSYDGPPVRFTVEELHAGTVDSGAYNRFWQGEVNRIRTRTCDASNFFAFVGADGANGRYHDWTDQLRTALDDHTRQCTRDQTSALLLLS